MHATAAWCPRSRRAPMPSDWIRRLRIALSEAGVDLGGCGCDRRDRRSGPDRGRAVRGHDGEGSGDGAWQAPDRGEPSGRSCPDAAPDRRGAFPYMLLLVSGGHCQILRVDDWDAFTRLGGTIDDAPGEAFDKVARLLGLPQPGGPSVEEEAQTAAIRPVRFSTTAAGSARVRHVLLRSEDRRACACGTGWCRPGRADRDRSGRYLRRVSGWPWRMLLAAKTAAL
jgi:hypothetical protein